jgi:hypothetical protein
VIDAHVSPSLFKPLHAAKLRIFGMRPNELAAPREKSKTGTVESRHNLLTRVLGNGFAKLKGDIKNAVDLQTYCREAKAEHDFETKGEVSPFEFENLMS